MRKSRVNRRKQVSAPKLLGCTCKTVRAAHERARNCRSAQAALGPAARADAQSLRRDARHRELERLTLHQRLAVGTEKRRLQIDVAPRQAMAWARGSWSGESSEGRGHANW